MNHGTEILEKQKLGKSYLGTLEERKDGVFISTLWNIENESEVDRTVVEFETYSAARAHMYQGLFILARNALRDEIQL